MEINIFGKLIVQQGKAPFEAYSTRLHNKATDTDDYFKVKFRRNCEGPSIDDCPCVIEVPREKMNSQEKIIVDKETKMPLVDENGQVKISRTIWISDWTYLRPFVDHSLDDYE